MGTSFERSDFWGRLSEQALVMIGRWKRLSTQAIPEMPEIVIPKTLQFLEGCD